MNPLLEEARHLRLKKRFSQHFLINDAVLTRIADALDLGPDQTVLEIGPGAGFLTEKLLDRAGEVVAVEVERRMCAYLRGKFGSRPNFHLIEQDILKYDFESLTPSRYTVVGNLPYAITSKIMFTLAGELDQADYPLRRRLRQVTVMVQKEVGERITAKPGQRAYNPLSIALQYWFEPRYDFTVPARDFCPPPQVESAVITLIPRAEPAVSVDDLPVFARLVRCAFGQKRKTVRNALINGSFASPAVLDRMFEQTGVDSGLRAEALSMQAFGDLANAFGKDSGEN